MTTDTTTTPAERLAELVEEYEPQSTDDLPAGDFLSPAVPWLLVEKSHYGTGHWFTLHVSARDALGYHDGQEYAEGWEPVLFVNLYTGEEEQYPSLGALAIAEVTAAGTVDEEIAGVMRRLDIDLTDEDLDAVRAILTNAVENTER